MSQEIEAAGLASAGGLTTGSRHPVKPGEPCRNCGAIVEERYCTRCGQLASDFHRPIWGLLTASLADSFSLDGRLWRSLPMLLLRPGRMTRNYLDGKRARYVPPFRMFLLASVVFFLTLFSMGDQLGWYDNLEIGNNLNTEGALILPDGENGISISSVARLEEVEQELADPSLSPDERAALIARRDLLSTGIPADELLDSSGQIDRDKLRSLVDRQMPDTAGVPERDAAWRAADHAATVFENQDRFGARIREWAPRFSLLFMPILAALFTLLFAWHRRKYIYDHLIGALHLQTFFYLLATLAMILSAMFPAVTGWFVVAALAVVPLYIYKHMRVAYRSGRILSLLRTFCFVVLGVLTLSALVLGMIVASFSLV